MGRRTRALVPPNTDGSRRMVAAAFHKAVFASDAEAGDVVGDAGSDNHRARVGRHAAAAVVDNSDD